MNNAIQTAMMNTIAESKVSSFAVDKALMPDSDWAQDVFKIVEDMQVSEAQLVLESAMRVVDEAAMAETLTRPLSDFETNVRKMMYED